MQRSDEEMVTVFIELETFGDSCGLDLMFGYKGFAVPETKHLLTLFRGGCH